MSNNIYHTVLVLHSGESDTEGTCCGCATATTELCALSSQCFNGLLKHKQLTGMIRGCAVSMTVFTAIGNCCKAVEMPSRFGATVH
jgi:hypothetical protein